MSPEPMQEPPLCTEATAGQTSFPNVWQGAGIAICYLALSSWLGSMVLMAAQVLHAPAWTSHLPSLLLGFPMALAFGLWLGRLDLWDILAFHRVRPGIWAPLLLTHVGFLILILSAAHGLEVGLDRFLPEPFHQNVLQSTKAMAEASPSVLALLFASAAIPEEILFRGLILRGLLGRHRPAIAVWISALLFMVAHGNPLQFPVALMIGACAGWYYQATGSLWPGLVAHGLHNLLAGYLLNPQALDANSLVVTPLPPSSWVLAAPLLVTAGLLWLRWHFNQAPPQPQGVLGLI